MSTIAPFFPKLLHSLMRINALAGDGVPYLRTRRVSMGWVDLEYPPDRTVEPVEYLDFLRLEHERRW